MSVFKLTENISIFPVVHGSFEFTKALRLYFLSNRPTLLAVELPEDMDGDLKRALPEAGNIPILSVLSETTNTEVHFVFEPLEPIVEAIRSAYEEGIPIHPVDLFRVNFDYQSFEKFPDTFSLEALGAENLYTLYKENSTHKAENKVIDEFDRAREVHMAKRLRALSSIHKGNILFVCGIKHARPISNMIQLSDEEFSRMEETSGLSSDMDEPLDLFINKNKNENIYNISVLSPQTTEILMQPGYFNTTWLLMRDDPEKIKSLNRIRLLRTVYRDTVQRYEKESGDLVPTRQEKLFFRFARNWSIIEGMLLPDKYRLLLSARGFGGDNFARIMSDVLDFIRPPNASSFPEKQLTFEDLDRSYKKILFRLKHKRKRKVTPPAIQKRFKKEKYPGEWQTEGGGDGICSYPPEDIVIEQFANFLKQKVNGMIHGSEIKTVPFTSSLLDGIDYRETIRNVHIGKIFVKELNLKNIEAGSVVIIFETDEADFPWKQTWWGEHSQESDMAFYGTYPSELVGPGIYRCRYGGLMMSYPPGHLVDFWNDPRYDYFDTASDKLVFAAIEHNDKNAVIHLAKKPPSAKLIQFASRVGQKIIHIPLTTINSVQLSRIQRFHVLDSKGRRDDAGDYIW